jgi:hypothetical protein
MPEHLDKQTGQRRGRRRAPLRPVLGAGVIRVQRTAPSDERPVAVRRPHPSLLVGRPVTQSATLPPARYEHMPGSCRDRLVPPRDRISDLIGQTSGVPLPIHRSPSGCSVSRFARLPFSRGAVPTVAIRIAFVILTVGPAGRGARARDRRHQFSHGESAQNLGKRQLLDVADARQPPRQDTGPHVSVRGDCGLTPPAPSAELGHVGPSSSASPDSPKAVDADIRDAESFQLSARLCDTLSVQDVDNAGPDRDVAAYRLGDVRSGACTPSSAACSMTFIQSLTIIVPVEPLGPLFE